MTGKELLDILLKLPPEALERQVISEGTGFESPQFMEQVVLCELGGVGGNYSFQSTPALMLVDWHTFGPAAIEAYKAVIYKPDRPLFAKTELTKEELDLLHNP
jgi:hypothetical protein